MPYCPQCGIDNPAAARFCDQCGAMLVPVAAPAAGAPTVSGPAMGAPPAAPATVTGAPLPAGPVICPQCGASAIPGEAFCDNCGAPLSAPARPAASAPPSYNAGIAPQPSYPPPQPAGVAQATLPQPTATPPGSHPLPQPIPAPPTVKPPTLPPKRLPPLPDLPAPPAVQPLPQPVAAPRTALAPAQLVVAASGAAIALPTTQQAILGRADAVSNFYPDIDLTPYGALDQGVGRRHVRLFISAGQLMAEDLDSTNGTMLNGRKLPARQPHPLNNGDQLQLGKLVLHVRL